MGNGSKGLWNGVAAWEMVVMGCATREGGWETKVWVMEGGRGLGDGDSVCV